MPRPTNSAKTRPPGNNTKRPPMEQNSPRNARSVSLGASPRFHPPKLALRPWSALGNKVTEAKKAAEANLIVRREETAAIRSQANTAKVLEGNPTLMRLRELEVLEKIASGGKLNVVLGEKGLADRVVNLI